MKIVETEMVVTIDLEERRKMKIVETEMVVTIDVDDTLILWDEPNDKSISILDPNDGSINRVTPHDFHIKLLKKHAGRGYTIIVWSQGGYHWARSVVVALGLQRYVDFVMTKPCKYIDDLPCAAWMGPRLYFDTNGKSVHE